MKIPRGFASDNNSGVHPQIRAAIAAANEGHVRAYGDDPFTCGALSRIQALFHGPAEAFFVFNGTGANVLALAAMTEPHHAVLCTENAHIHVDECGAPERFTGCKLLTAPTPDGKLTAALCERLYRGVGDQHHVQPRVVAVSQSTEMGTLYSAAELKALADWAHARDMFLYVDGARIGNAAASLGLSLRQMLEESGVDVFSFGGTKNGILFGEAVVFLNPELAAGFRFRRKQGMQLGSKMRFLACQFEALLTNELWLESARHANAMANLLEKEMSGIPGVRITQKVEANGVFAVIPKEAIAKLQAKSFFYVWNESTSEVRWLTSWDTTPEDIHAFAAEARKILS
ncbi:MAG: threonine aldolase family protein [Bdellovibrionota bacterium]